MLRATIMTIGLALVAMPVLASAPVAPLAPVATVDPVRLVKARELVAVMHVDAQMHDVMRPMMMTMLKGAAAGRLAAGAPAPSRAEADQAATGMSIMADEVERLVAGSMPQIIEGAAIAYARNLSASEIEGATAFYRTPTGQSLIAKLPLIMNDMNTSTGAALLKPMVAQMPAIIAKIKAAQGDAPSATPTGK